MRPTQLARWALLVAGAAVAVMLNGYAFVIYELVQCDALDGSGIAGDGRLATMCGRDNSLASVGFWVFVLAGLASLAAEVACWRRGTAPARLLGVALLLVTPVVAYLALALTTP
jgi:hypothetical protein